MRQLLPSPVAEVDLLRLHFGADRPPPDDRPWVLLNMAASVDGATAVDGVSRDLGGEGDRLVFRAVRALPDAILAAAGTVRAEGYGPPRPSEQVRAERVHRGLAEHPRMVVVTASLDLDWDSALFTEAPDPVLVVTTTGADADRLAAASEAGAELVEAGEGRVDLVAALSTLRARGIEVLLVEGGPSLNGQLAELDVFDEVFVTVSPHLVGGDAARLCSGGAPGLRELELTHVLEHGGALFARYLRRR